MRIAITLAALMLAIGAGSYWVLESGTLDAPLEDLEPHLATPDSRFANVDGVRVHYMDQGEGPAVALLHASFLNLRAWDSMAAALSENFRVVRMDFLISGLTGPEPANDYSIERNIELFAGLMQQLGIDEFAIVGTSSGGVVAFRHAARFPEKVTRLVLINSAGMPRTAASNPNRARGSTFKRWRQARYKSRADWRNNLDLNFAEPHEPPDWLVDLAYYNGRREGLRQDGMTFMRNYRTGDPKATLAGVRAPTMVLWGLANTTVMHLEADVFEHWLVNAPTLLKKYAGAGHYGYIEEPQTFETDVRAFLRGELDAQLTRTTRVTSGY